MSASATAASSASTKADTLSPMQQELLNRADSIFSSIANAVSQAGDLAVSAGQAVAKEIPDIALQYVLYGRALSTSTILLTLLVLYMGYRLFKYADKCHRSDCVDERQSAGPMSACGLLIMACSAFVFVINFKNFIMVWFAPKVWLILEMTQLVSSLK